MCLHRVPLEGKGLKLVNKKLDILKAGFYLAAPKRAPDISLYQGLCKLILEAIWVPLNLQPTLSITVSPDPFQHPQFSLGVYLCAPVMQLWRPEPQIDSPVLYTQDHSCPYGLISLESP